MEGGNKFPKVFLIILGVVFIVLLAEGGYYLYGKRQKPASTSQPTSEDATRNIVTPAPGERYLRYDKFASIADSFQRLVPKSSFFLSATMNYTVYGTVDESVFEDKVVGGTRFAYKLQLSDDKDQTIIYRFTNEDLKTTKVILKNPGGTDASMDLKEIKVNDKVIMRSETDFLAGAEADLTTIEVNR